jgi:hypothetical protein
MKYLKYYLKYYEKLEFCTKCGSELNNGQCPKCDNFGEGDIVKYKMDGYIEGTSPEQQKDKIDEKPILRVEGENFIFKDKNGKEFTKTKKQIIGKISNQKEKGDSINSGTLKDKLLKIIEDYESNINQSSQYQDSSIELLQQYQKEIGIDETFSKALKLNKKSILVSWFNTIKSKSKNQEYIKDIDDIFSEYINDDVDDFDDIGAMQKSLLMDMATSYISKEKNKEWKDKYLNLVKSYDPKKRNDLTIARKMLSLDIMTSVASKPDKIKHKSEFDKIYLQYELDVDNKKSDADSSFLQNIYKIK